MTDKELLDKAIVWLINIADDMEHITSGNVSHQACNTKGKAIRAVEYLEKHRDSLPEEPVSDRLVFKALPRLLDTIEPSDRTKAYIAKLADSLEAQGYHTDAKIVRESIKIMNGEKVAMATMDEELVSNDLEEASDEYAEKHPTCGLAKTSFKAGAQWQLNKIKCLVDKINVNNYNFEYLEGLYDALCVMTK